MHENRAAKNGRLEVVKFLDASISNA